MTIENKPAFQLLDHEHKHNNSVVTFPQGQTFKLDVLLDKVNAFFRQLTLTELSERLNKEGFGKLTIYSGKHSRQDWDVNYWNQRGVEAEILDSEAGSWKKGKVRMRVVLEFCPDEPEELDIDRSQHNSLEDIRNNIA